jgi:hypothetical protein
MRKIIIFFVAAFACVWASSAHATLSFNADFGQNGIYEAFWPMKAGDVVSVDIYVSNVPAPGLISMGFKLTYDSSKLAVVTASTAVAIANWPLAPNVKYINAAGDIDEIHMYGFRTEAGLAGNNILLGTVTFQYINEGTSPFMLLDREADWFVLENATVLDGDIGAGVLLGTILEYFDLTVTKSGTGKGTVTSSPPGINCGTDCTESLVSGTTVLLTAAQAQDSLFVSWTGCDTVSANTCTVNMTGDRTVSAVFNDDFPWEAFIPAFTKHK